MMKQDNKELNNKADSLHSILLSIIIPIFNAEKHLQTLIEVLAKQIVLNEPNFEIFMVDDGPTDNSASIIKDFQNIYTNIHYIYQDNAGMTVARNNGMDRARGEYIYMMDQDDVMVPNTLIPFTKFAKEQNSDVLLFQFKKIKPEEKLGWEEKLQTKPQVIEVTDGAKYIEANDGLMHTDVGAPPWSNIYSRKFLQNNGLRFEMYKMYFEDTIFNWKVFVKAKKVVILSNIVYYWIQYPTSESHTREFDRRLAKHINDVKASILMKQLAQQIKKEYPNRPLLYQLAMGASYEFQFILWAFAIKNKGLDHKTAIRLLREGKQNGAYPISHMMPDMMDYPSKAKILYFLISWEPILRLMLLLRSTKSVK